MMALAKVKETIVQNGCGVMNYEEAVAYDREWR